MTYHAGGAGITSPDTNGLFAGSYPVVDRKVTLVGGADLPAGAVLGEVTASGVYRLSVADAADGSEVPAAILSHPVEGADTEAVVYLSGYYLGEALTFGAGHTAATTAKGLRGLGIFIR